MIRFAPQNAALRMVLKLLSAEKGKEGAQVTNTQLGMKALP